jgi:hypothetical protein
MYSTRRARERYTNMFGRDKYEQFIHILVNTKSIITAVFTIFTSKMQKIKIKSILTRSCGAKQYSIYIFLLFTLLHIISCIYFFN